MPGSLEYKFFCLAFGFSIRSNGLTFRRLVETGFTTFAHRLDAAEKDEPAYTGFERLFDKRPRPFHRHLPVCFLTFAIRLINGVRIPAQMKHDIHALADALDRGGARQVSHDYLVSLPSGGRHMPA